MNIALISFNSGGTMGHMTLITKLLKKINKKNKVFLFTDHDYHSFTNVKIDSSQMIKLPHQKHMRSAGGKITYKYFNYFIDEVVKRDIKVVIFSTFYDPHILKLLKEKNIKRILISYPLRDSFRMLMKVRKYYNFFDKILTLNDISDIKVRFPNEEIVSFLETKYRHPVIKNHKKKNILITCGGGGRPSSKLFWQQITKVIKFFEKNNKDLFFTLIKGNSKVSISTSNSMIINWSNNFSKLLNKADFVISEGGYYTLIDLISLEKPAILIPGERRIDNQELRAINFERKGLGFCILPVEDSKIIINKISVLIDNPKIMSEFSKNIKSFKRRFFKHPGIIKALNRCIK